MDQRDESSEQSIIELDHLRASYGETTVLHDVTCSIRRGEITVILGASGSGKTTMLRHILGLIEPASGSVRIFGTELGSAGERELAAVRRRLGVLFQEGALLNSRSVGLNVRVPLEQHTTLPTPVVDRVVATKLRLVGLEESIDVMPGELSGGMRKRASLARALALDPELLLCDEPSSGLDPITSKALDELLLDLKESLAMTMLVISHDIASVRRVADRVLFLHQGRILFDGTMQEADASPRDELRRYFDAGG